MFNSLQWFQLQVVCVKLKRREGRSSFYLSNSSWYFPVNVSLNWAADICLLQINHPVRLILPGELQNLSAGCLLCRTLANIYNLFLYSEAESCGHERPQSAASGTVQQNILHYKEWCLIQTVHAKVKVYVEAVWKRGASCSRMFCVNLSRVLIEDLNMQK